MMNDLQRQSVNTPMPLHSDPTTVGISVALDTLKQALNAGVEVMKLREIGQTQRVSILAEKEVKIAQIREEIKRGMADDQHRHDQKMELISIVRDLLVPNAPGLTPEIITAAQGVLQCLKEL